MRFGLIRQLFYRLGLPIAAPLALALAAVLVASLPPRSLAAPDSVPAIGYLAAVNGTQDHPGAEASLQPSLLKNLRWRNIGPGITSGRIADIAVVEDNTDIIYLATATGGAWKSTNGGTTWKAVFENSGTASMGAIVVAPSNPNVVWVGTGEDFNARSNSWGDGVYKSEDGGKTWEHMGLEETRHIGRIVIHPEDPNVVYVAGMGSLWGPGEERGLFKTPDGGKSWEKVLYISQHTGVVDVAMDPRDPDLLYAAAFQRERRNWSFVAGGPEGAIYKSTDGGESWNKLTNGLPEGDVGRIGLSICRSRPDRVYAAVRAKDEENGIYRSDDRGASWEQVSNEVATRWSYGELRCDPNDPHRVYVLATSSSVSADGGTTYRPLVTGGGVHVDHRAFWIDPNDSTHLILGTDGGVYLSDDRGANWNFVTNLPVTQFYTVAVDLQEPFYYVYGGTQDNNSMGGPSGTRYTDGIANEDWFMTVGGDGFHAQIDPEDPTIVYTESQYGRLVRFNTVTGERRRIQPAHPEGGKNRWNWSSPVHISRYDNETVYFCANVVFKSTDRGDTWEVISPDLTRQLDHFEMPLMGKVQPMDAIGLHTGTSDYGNITSFSESPIGQGLLAVGTDDGLIQVTRNDGGSWVEAGAPSGVPEMTRVSRVAWSHHHEGTLYATFDGHKDNSFPPYVYKSTDYGATWVNITGDLPGFGSTRVIVEHPRNPDLLFVGTEFGAFASITGGDRWVQLKEGLPTVPVHDMVIHPRENDLVIGTHGRGFFILDDIAILEELSEEVLASDLHLASVRPATQMHKFNRGRRSLGHTHFTAPNPPDGAIITYYVNPQIMKTGGEVLTGAGPGYQDDGPDDEGGPGQAGQARADEGQGDARGEAGESRATDEQEVPRIEVEVLDGEGQLIRRLEAPQGPEGTGIQRLVWDLRHPLAFGVDEEDSAAFFRGPTPGPFVLPAEYRVRLRVGEAEKVRSVQVVGDPAIEISAADRRVWHDTLQALNRMLGSVNAVMSTLREVEEQLQDVDEALTSHPQAPPGSLRTRLEEINEALEGIRLAMLGVPPRSRAELAGAPAIAEQVRQLFDNIEASTALPTADQRRLTRSSYEKLGQQIEALNRLVSEDLSALHDGLDRAGIRWTRGRSISLLPADLLPPPPR